ncbi:Uncharacterised protein [Citrobacter werkmanii]|nr:Uncharacterised protein [Citrobacter werkmanii]
MQLRVFSCRSGEYANHAAGGSDEPAFRSSRTYVQIRPVFVVFSCPAPAPALEYHLYAVCGSSSRSDKGLRPAAPLNGSTHPPSWRAVRGSAPPRRARISVWRYSGRCSQYLAVNTRASRPGPAIPRSTGRDGAGASTIPSHFVQAFFYPHCADHFQGAGNQLQLLRADFAEVRHFTATCRAAGFFRLQPEYLTGKMFRKRTTVPGLTELAGNLRVVFPPTVTIARLFALFQQRFGLCHLAAQFFQNGCRTSYGAVFLSETSGVLSPVRLPRSFLQRGSAQSAGRPQSRQRD